MSDLPYINWTDFKNLTADSCRWKISILRKDFIEGCGLNAPVFLAAHERASEMWSKNRRLPPVPMPIDMNEPSKQDFYELELWFKQAMAKPPNLVTLEVAAKQFQRTKKTIGRWIKAGKIKSYPDDTGKVFVDAKEIASRANRRKTD